MDNNESHKILKCLNQRVITVSQDSTQMIIMLGNNCTIQLTGDITYKTKFDTARDTILDIVIRHDKDINTLYVWVTTGDCIEIKTTGLILIDTEGSI